MKIIMKILLRGKNLLFPGECALCKTSLIEPNEIQTGLCEECGISIVQIDGDKCGVCGKPLVSERDTCLPCRNRQTQSYDRLWVLFPYTGKYRKLLTEYKFRKNLSLGDFFAEKVIRVIEYEPFLKDAVLVPVPPRPGKIKDSGWDQVEHLIKRINKISGGFPVNRCLKRIKSRVQKSLTRAQRLDNLKGRIIAAEKAPKNAIIIDDVITTGSTMEVCAQALKAAGAEKVYGICLFYD